MSRKFITTGSKYEEMAQYSRAVADGDMIWVSGTVGVDFKTGQWPQGAAAQADKALDTIEWALKQADADLMDVVQVRVFVPNPANVPEVSAVLARRVGPARPTNTTICAPCPVPEALVEIEVTAKRRPR